MSHSPARTLGELKAQGYSSRSVKDELRANVQAALRAGRPLFPGIVGYDQTVVPEIVNALLSRHDFILLGLRGQAKTRLVRGLIQFLDPRIPAIDGTTVPDDPFAPVSAAGRRILREAGDDTPLRWLTPDERFFEKLATPDVTIADLIGDVDPIKAAQEGLHLDDEEVIQFGMVPRAHRGIFAINELPDLAPRIQVGLLNIMEEKDVQIRSFPVRLQLDVMMVFTANPEDYTNRGSIITPLKDRIDSQIHTHYPRSLRDAAAITEQEAWTDRGHEVVIPPFLREVVDLSVFLARESDFIDAASGVSARASISAYENLISNVERRSIVQGGPARARVCDLPAIIPALAGKIELAYEGEQEGAQTVCRDLVGKALLRVFLEYFPDPKAKSGRPEETALDGGGRQGRPDVDRSVYGQLVSHFSGGATVEVGDSQSDAQYRQALESVPGLRELVDEHAPEIEDSDRPAAMELVLEAMFQSSFVAKENLDRGTLYSDMLLRMMDGIGRRDG